MSNFRKAKQLPEQFSHLQIYADLSQFTPQKRKITLNNYKGIAQPQNHLPLGLPCETYHYLQWYHLSNHNAYCGPCITPLMGSRESTQLTSQRGEHPKRMAGCIPQTQAKISYTMIVFTLRSKTTTLYVLPGSMGLWPQFSLHK